MSAYLCIRLIDCAPDFTRKVISHFFIISKCSITSQYNERNYWHLRNHYAFRVNDEHVPLNYDTPTGTKSLNPITGCRCWKQSGAATCITPCKARLQEN